MSPCFASLVRLFESEVIFNQERNPFFYTIHHTGNITSMAYYFVWTGSEATIREFHEFLNILKTIYCDILNTPLTLVSLLLDLER